MFIIIEGFGGPRIPPNTVPPLKKKALAKPAFSETDSSSWILELNEPDADLGASGAKANTLLF